MNMKKRRALILYATMSSNTEKIANAFSEVFDSYNWEVCTLRIRSQKELAEHQEELYFDDYDVICLGSPIVGGMPLQPVIRAFSMGGGGALERNVAKEMKGESAQLPQQPPKGKWRRNDAPYSGVLNKGDSRPLGIVFSTYGGGFYGSSECMPVLQMLKLYLNTYSVDVQGYFACGGKEHGPAGYPLGVKPKKEFRPGPPDPNIPDADVCDPQVYEMKDGTQKYGSYFFHYDLEGKPGEREIMKAKAFAADFIEDFFMTYDGQPNPPLSSIVSIS
jgi:hypothetical protein